MDIKLKPGGDHTRVKMLIEEFEDVITANRMKGYRSVKEFDEKWLAKLLFKRNPFERHSWVEELEEKDRNPNLERKEKVHRFVHLLVYMLTEAELYFESDKYIEVNTETSHKKMEHFMHTWDETIREVKKLGEYLEAPFLELKDKLKKEGIPTPQYNPKCFYNDRLQYHIAYVCTYMRHIQTDDHYLLFQLRETIHALNSLAIDVVYEYDQFHFPPGLLDYSGLKSK